MSKKNINIIKRQEPKYLDNRKIKAFHVLSINGSYRLIGSQKIRNFLYSNDYDLNESFNVTNNKKVLENIYNHFLEIFHKCYKDKNYYILDFKCGHTDKMEPIRWTYEDMKKGKQTINNKEYSFIDCLTQKENNVKLDAIFILDNEPLDITNNYFIHIVKDKEELKEKHKLNADKIIKELDEKVHIQIKEGNYFKALKRLMSKEIISQKIDINLLHFLNSDYGRFYKMIHDLDVLLLLSENNFKPISKLFIINNLERIKEFGSQITYFNIDHILDKINYIIEHHNNLDSQLLHLINYSENLLHEKIKKKLDNFIK